MLLQLLGCTKPTSDTTFHILLRNCCAPLEAAEQSVLCGAQGAARFLAEHAHSIAAAGLQMLSDAPEFHFQLSLTQQLAGGI